MRTCIATLALVWTVTALNHTASAEDGERWLPITLEDGSQLNAVLADDAIPLQTQYGLLAIPSHQVRRIAFAVRPSAEQAARIAAAIEALERDPQAKTTLVQTGEQALPALIAAAHTGRLEQAESIREVISAIAQAHQGVALVRDRDIVETAQGTIHGTHPPVWPADAEPGRRAFYRRPLGCRPTHSMGADSQAEGTTWPGPSERLRRPDR